ncbi:MAG: valine--tRNA ligase [Clostridia bacterium]|nr:valine--tRNA ligase [Clostridia bacterium]
MELPKTYDPKEREDRIYDRWLKNGYFHAEIDPDKTPFTIVIPPPNITGQLHMGHALDETIQDAIIRAKRMQGYSALWLPGTDHASIATEVKIVDAMAEEGLSKEEVGREGFLERAWAWRDEYGGRIVKQLMKLGSSCDWERERFTMDEGLSRAVRTAFKKLYDDGLIYQGDRIINWCPSCETALSDAEVEYAEENGHLWHIRYPGEDGSEGVVVATTRPETMLGDTAVAVNPNDERYSHLIGTNVVLPLTGRTIPVVADEYVDMEFGTGAVKITPAHDPNDYEVGVRHNLPSLRIMDDQAVINELGGSYAGLTREEARRKIVADLDEQGLLVKTEDHVHNVGHCYRCGTTVEPIISKQWFVSMKPLAEPAIRAVEEGETQFVPGRFSKIYFNWLNNIRDWCISRQLWWGHRIPAYTCQNCGRITVSIDEPEACEHCGSTELVQDPDVLDTWFSSGLWPFSTLGWPDKTPDLEYFYPTNVMVTGYDIIFFWVARMMMFGLNMMGQVPFAFVDIHGLVRDEQGRKMSKSLGNGVDPLKIIEEYGADALRFSLAVGVSPGNDMRFYTKKVESARNFANKIWNASRFVLMNVPDERQKLNPERFDLADRWILSRLDDAVREITSSIDRMELGLAAEKIYDFIWSEFCDWYVEMAKSRLYGDDEQAKRDVSAVLVYVLEATLKLLHPLMPFITEEIYTNLPGSEETIMLSAWPEEAWPQFADDAARMQDVMEMVRQIRNLRAEMNVPPSVRTKIFVAASDPDLIRDVTPYLEKLAFGSEIVLLDEGQVPEGCVSAVSPAGTAYVEVAELVDVDKERARLEKEIAKTENEVSRAEAKLANTGFTSKAPANVVEAEREKLAKNQDVLKRLKERLQLLAGAAVH